MTEREQFEAWISAPPYERSVERYAFQGGSGQWPGDYVIYGVELAWCAWQERARLAGRDSPAAFTDRAE